MREETKQLIKNILIGLGVFVLVGVLLYGIWHGTRLSSLTIDQVIVEGGETISHDIIRSDVTRLLQGEYVRFVPRAFAWTYPEQEILASVTAVERVKAPILIREGTTLIVRFAEFEPEALWCDARTSGTCVFLDDGGYAFATAPALDGGTFTRYVTTGQPATTSTRVIEEAQFAQLRELVVILEQAGWPVEVIEIDQVGDAFVFLVGGAELKTSLALTPQQTFDNLQATLSADKYQHLTSNNFVYIDLRFGNKIFVKEFPDAVESVATSTEAIKNAISNEIAN